MKFKVEEPLNKDLFISEFKKTSYYESIISDEKVIGIYLVGSACFEITDDYSDYDLLIFTSGNDHINVSEELELTFRGRTAHWMYFPLKDLFNPFYAADLRILCPIQLDIFLEHEVVYENPKFKSVMNKVKSIKKDISKLAVYSFFEAQSDLVENLIYSKDIAAENYSKYIYHLCFSVYYLLRMTPDVDFLREIKRIQWSPVRQEYKELALKILKLGSDFIKANPRNYRKELKGLYNEIY